MQNLLIVILFLSTVCLASSENEMRDWAGVPRSQEFKKASMLGKLTLLYDVSSSSMCHRLDLFEFCAARTIEDLQQIESQLSSLYREDPQCKRRNLDLLSYVKSMIAGRVVQAFPLEELEKIDSNMSDWSRYFASNNSKERLAEKLQVARLVRVAKGAQ